MNPAVKHIFSVDVEEYFQVNAFDGAIARSSWHRFPSRLAIGVDRILELLDRHGAHGTFFVLGWTAARNTALVRRIADAGHEVASHGWSHRRVTTLTPSEFRTELRDSKHVLEDLSGGAVEGFRAPSFSIGPRNAWAFDVLIEEGFRYDSSVFPIRRPGYGVPGAPHVPYVVQCAAGRLLELPLSTLALGPLRLPAAGGGYLRHLPYVVTSRALRASQRCRIPAMTYVHPWELDPDQPRLPVSFLARLRHYRGLSRTLPRLERLMREFRFTSVRRSTFPELSAAIGDASPVSSSIDRALA